MAAASVAGDVHLEPDACWARSTRISTTLWIWPLVAPLCQSSARERDQYQASPVSMVRASASAFMWATISSSPVSASVVTQVTRPSAPKRGVRRCLPRVRPCRRGGERMRRTHGKVSRERIDADT